MIPWCNLALVEQQFVMVSQTWGSTVGLPRGLCMNHELAEKY
jgi:hypothetical protein